MFTLVNCNAETAIDQRLDEDVDYTELNRSHILFVCSSFRAVAPTSKYQRVECTAKMFCKAKHSFILNAYDDYFAK